MKYKLLSVGKCEEISSVNIGDYIQALASSQFYPHIDGFIDRDEELKNYDGETCKVIMNGWFMHNPHNWPPSNKIIPLFVAFHLNLLSEKLMTDSRSLLYLRQHGPIGCRDLFTTELLKNKSVDAYFSGCMTLTLGYKYKSVFKEDKCYFVDPYFKNKKDITSLINNFIYLLFHWRSVSIISSKYPKNLKGIKKRMALVTFYREYSRIFTKETLLNAEYICQQNTHYKDDFKTDEERLFEAERLIRKYAKAKLVVTSRIHCALPCLGLETPVIYTENADQSKISSCRLGGLRELFTILKWNKGHLENSFPMKGKLSISNHPENNSNWKFYAEKLISKCKTFIDSDISSYNS